ncbi:MAG: hypothetical protein KJI69_02005 [Patescibacteria group bacterium]|nr:hypothetical protein [Patescibacteria group bacterium]
MKKELKNAYFVFRGRIRGAIFLRLFKKKVVRNYQKYCDIKQGHALLYYKTDPFVFRGIADDYSHVNNWHILEIAKILNKLGFWVDIIDRTVKNIDTTKLQDQYDIFIGAAPAAFKNYEAISGHINKATKILFATSRETTVHNESLQKRHDYFLQRHPDVLLPKLGFLENFDKEETIKNIDAIFYLGTNLSMEDYRSYGKPMYKVFDSTDPRIVFDLESLKQRSQKKFLYFAGTNNILKGLDLLIEVFSKLPDLELFICTPAKEKKFEAFYRETLANSPNIHWVGFVQVAGDKFRDLTSKCGYVILLSCTEAEASSVTSCMRRGMVPVVSPGADIDVKDFGHLIKDISLESLQLHLSKISKEPRNIFVKRMYQSYMDSFNYTQAKFSESFEKALINILNSRSKMFGE